ncbi:MAG: MFS transporter [Legionellales bacterium]|nr:MFS transporter [Legionellales bacterium]|tara:strand:- start:15385 stop:16641 length:1257 start_codon:yes stop_codon:yes gene_type:complete
MEKRIFNRSLLSWCLYDWASSPFSTIIITFVFAAYFTSSIATSSIKGTELWGDASSFAALIIAILSPIFGAIADNYGRRKPWLGLFVLLTAVATALLWYALPEHQSLAWVLTWVVIGTIAFELGNVFYNAMMPGLAPERYLGRVSGWAWGTGYVGGLVCLFTVLYCFIHHGETWFGLSKATAAQIRVSGPFVSVWLVVFALPLFLFTKDRQATGLSLRQATHKGLRELGSSIKKILMHREVFKFLIARMIYIDGLNTLFAFGGIYAAGTFHMSMSEILAFGIAMNITAGIGAFTLAWVDDWIGSKRTILIAIIGLCSFGVSTVLAPTKMGFWVFALPLGLFVGPVQAASRTMLARLAPRELITEAFGLYALSGKATAFVGPWLLGYVTYLFNSQRAGMSTVLVFMLVGGIILLFVRED